MSPVPKHLRTEAEICVIPENFKNHVIDLEISPKKVKPCRHPCKFQPGLATALHQLAKSDSLGDPMAGSGRLVEETDMPFFLNEIDEKWRSVLEALDTTVTFDDARNLQWSCEVMTFSPPYYPKTDRNKPCHHDDNKRGPVVGFRDSYGGQDISGFVGDPGGVDAILHYRTAMREIYAKLRENSDKMIVVTKNWTRLGTELRLDLDTILTTQEVGWAIAERHGWIPQPSLWSRFNQARNSGVQIEDVLVFVR